MTPTFTYESTTVQLLESIPDYDWGQSQDLENIAIDGTRHYEELGDYADVSFYIHAYKLTAQEIAAIKSCRGKSGTLVTDIGTATFYCFSIKYDTLAENDSRLTLTLTFKSEGYV